MTRRIAVPVMLSCNNHRNGMHRGFVERIEIGDRWGDVFLALDGYCRVSEPFKCQGVLGTMTAIRIGRFRYPIVGYTRWSGNWCWDRAQMHPGRAARLLNNLRASGKWSPHEGHSWFWDLWKSGQPFAREHFEDAERLAAEWEAAEGGGDG